MPREPRYSIVPAAPPHLGAIPQIERAAAGMFPTEDLPRPLRYRVTAFEELASAQRDGRLWIALGNDAQPVGFAMAAILDGQGHLDEMDVHPDHTRRGIGTRLVNTVIDWARSTRFAGLTLVTFRHLPWNAPFYERLGFVRLSKRDMSDGMLDLIREEGEAGIDVDKRVGMRLELT